MRLIYSIEYTQYSAEHRANFQNNTWISGSRGQSLTLDGCQRILRKTHPKAIVIRKQQWIDGR